jgi:transposase
MFIGGNIRYTKPGGAMLIKTLLNKVEKYKSFVYGKVHWETISGEEALVVEIRPRANADPECPKCRRRFGVYDTQPARLYEYVPLWGFKVFFHYSPRRADCPDHGALVEHAPWAQGKEHQATSYKVFLATWAKRLSWLEVARVFRTSWDTVYRAVKYVVDYGLAHRKLDNVETIGVDEYHTSGGQNYLTMVYQLDEWCKQS